MIEVKNLHVYYGVIEAVKGISFLVQTGQIVSLIGSNGAGKTSTLNALINSVKRSGEIKFLGYDTSRHKTHTIVKQGIALVPEGRRAFINLSVEETRNMTYVKYTQQPVIVLTNSRGTRRYIRAEGNIIFKPMIEDKKLNSDMDLFRFFK